MVNYVSVFTQGNDLPWNPQALFCFQSTTIIVSGASRLWLSIQRLSSHPITPQKGSLISPCLEGQGSYARKDKNLDKQGKVHVHFDDEVPFDGSCCVYLANDWDGGIGLTALEALSLLGWLMDEKTRLEAKAKEEE